MKGSCNCFHSWSGVWLVQVMQDQNLSQLPVAQCEEIVFESTRHFSQFHQEGMWFDANWCAFESTELSSQFCAAGVRHVAMKIASPRQACCLSVVYEFLTQNLCSIMKQVCGDSAVVGHLQLVTVSILVISPYSEVWLTKEWVSSLCLPFLFVKKLSRCCKWQH